MSTPLLPVLDLNPADRAPAYGLLGGMPLDLSWWDAGESVREDISRLACRPTAPMLVEGDYLLATETRHGDRLADVLRAIAEGRTRHQEIADAIGGPQQNASGAAATAVGRTAHARDGAAPSADLPDHGPLLGRRVLGRYRSEIDRGLGATRLSAVIDGVDDRMGTVWETAFRDCLRRHADPSASCASPTGRACRS